MISVTRVLLVVTLLGLSILATPHHSVQADQAQFALAVGQSVTVGQYTLLFRGMSGTLPAYDLYLGSALLARYPSPTSHPYQTEYSYGQ